MNDGIWESSIDFIAGGIVGLLSWFFGGRDGFIMVLLAFSVIDQLSGLAAGWVKHELSSEQGFNGIARKVMIFAFVGMAHLTDRYLLGNTDTLRTAVCMFYIGNEGISILENADVLGIPFPDYFKSHFLNMKKDKKDKKS